MHQRAQILRQFAALSAKAPLFVKSALLIQRALQYCIEFAFLLAAAINLL